MCHRFTKGFIYLFQHHMRVLNLVSRVHFVLSSAIRIYRPFLACLKYAARGSASTSVVICTGQRSYQHLGADRLQWSTQHRMWQAKTPHTQLLMVLVDDLPSSQTRKTGQQQDPHLVNAGQRMHDD